MNKGKKIFIVAGTVEEFVEYNRKKSVEWLQNTTDTELNYFTQYQYVSNVNQLRGIEDITGYFIGSYASRPDIEEIKLVIAMLKNRVMYKIENNLQVLPSSSIAINGVNTPINLPFTDIREYTAILDETVPGLTAGSVKITQYKQFENNQEKMKALEEYFANKAVTTKERE